MPATRATPPAIVHLEAAQLRAAAAVIEVRGINPKLVAALDQAAAEINRQHSRKQTNGTHPNDETELLGLAGGRADDNSGQTFDARAHFHR